MPRMQRPQRGGTRTSVRLTTTSLIAFESASSSFDVTTPKVAVLSLATLKSPIKPGLLSWSVLPATSKLRSSFFGLSGFTTTICEYAAKSAWSTFPRLHRPRIGYDRKNAIARHRKMILEFQGYKEFDETARDELTGEIRSMAISQAKPTFMFREALEILERRKVEIPNSWTLNELILDEIKRHKRELTATIDEHLAPTTRDFLDGLLETPDDDDPEGRLQKSKLALLKRISQSTKPFKIKGTVDDFRTIRNLYRDVEPVLNLLDLTPEGIRFYAEAVIRFKLLQVSRRADDDRHLHLVCFACTSMLSTSGYARGYPPQGRSKHERSLPT